jgi:hypothetical protein
MFSTRKKFDFKTKIGSEQGIHINEMSQRDGEQKRKNAVQKS